MDELKSMQAIRDVFHKLECEHKEYAADSEYMLALWDVANEIRLLPSVNPQPTGHWIDGGEYICFGGRQKAPCICSVCRKSALNEPWYYCPNCGVRMKEGD